MKKFIFSWHLDIKGKKVSYGSLVGFNKLTQDEIDVIVDNVREALKEIKKDYNNENA